MTAALQEILLAPDTQPKVIADCETLIQQEVSRLSGISGTAVKLAYKTVVKFAPDHIHYMVETLLPRLAEELQPFWTDFQVSGGSEFGDYLAKRSDEVSEALLSVTDERGRGLQPAHGHESVRRRPRPRGQARRGRPPRRRRPGPEVRDLTTNEWREGTALSALASMPARRLHAAALLEPGGPGRPGQ